MDETQLDGSASMSPQVKEEKLSNGNERSSEGNRGTSAETGSPPPSTSSQGRSPKKRRKVNHACVYCRRSHMTCDDERPCTRCIKRNIGHLCHDETRDTKKTKGEGDHHSNEDETSPAKSSTPPAGTDASPGQGATAPQTSMPPPRSTGGAINVAPSASNSSEQAGLNLNSQSLTGFPDFLPQQNWNPYHHQFMFSNPEVSTEYNLMNEFLLNSIYDDPLFSGNDGLFPDSTMNSGTGGLPSDENNQNLLRLGAGSGNQSPMAPQQNAVTSLEKARELYYMTAADPPTDGPSEERMKQVLKAKLDAGLLKPFNYINGYKRLQNYMDKTMAPTSKVRIQRSLEKFRPKFRERTQALTDYDLVFVEEWFERSLMEYDRVFASMAVPACLWRRTGEIFRGNKEFAELIHVPIEHMRDGKLAIYELIAEDSAVSYWEKFGAIAFDTSQKAMLTSCYLKNPDPNSKDSHIHCCFSFTIRRDSYNIPSMIIGNFLPIPP